MFVIGVFVFPDFAPQGAEACSLGREPQVDRYQEIPEPRRGDGKPTLRGGLPWLLRSPTEPPGRGRGNRAWTVNTRIFTNGTQSPLSRRRLPQAPARRAGARPGGDRRALPVRQGGAAH